ncbi:hypothetical protein BGX21_008883 [Mortierella sp. AD011]|nr:hypothetical protein BGX20_005922 [Mortierella sp. AD010]KAF9397420.1 hypothetical protein BGX21_008883 [Mortierella sp. AD011]
METNKMFVMFKGMWLEENDLSSEERAMVVANYMHDGDKYRDKGDFDEAIKCYKKALRHRPDEARDRIGGAYILKGDVRRDGGKLRDAAKYYKKALEYSQDEAMNRLEEIHQRKISVDDKGHSDFITKNLKKAKNKIDMSTFRHHDPILTGTYFPSSTPNNPGNMPPPSLPVPSNTINIGSATFKPSNTKDLVTLFKTDRTQRDAVTAQIGDIITLFNGSSVSFEKVQELVVLASVPDTDIFMSLINKMVKVIKDSPILRGVLLRGMAVMLNSCPDDVDFENLNGVFPDILRPLMDRLEIICTDQNTHQLIPLLEVLNALLDTMVGRKVDNLDRQGIYEPLITLLDGLVSHEDDTVSFLAIYAKQSIAFIGDDESTMMGFFRNCRQVAKIARNLAAMTQLSSYDIETLLQDIAKLCDFTLRYAWYRGLLYVDCVIGLEDWMRFEKFVVDSKLNRNRFFLQGVCIRLEQIVATHENVAVRDGATKFLEDLEMKFTGMVKKVAGEALERLKSSSDPDTHMTDAMSPDDSSLREFRSDLRPVWDPIWQATPASILFKVVQANQQQADIILDIPCQFQGINASLQDVGRNVQDVGRNVQDVGRNVQDVGRNVQDIGNDFRDFRNDFRQFSEKMSSQSQMQVQGQHIVVDQKNMTVVSNRSQQSPVDPDYVICGRIQSELYAYYKRYLAIQRVSGGELDLDNSIFNLVIVKSTEQRRRDKSRIQGPTVAGSNSSIPKRSTVRLEGLFGERDLLRGCKKILIQGQAGVGKTTLCKRLVIEARSGQWGHLFSFALWIPLRQLKMFKARSIEDLLREKFFPHLSEKKRDILVNDLATLVYGGRVLFILDGWDEIFDSAVELDMSLAQFLMQLLDQKYVIITSRPSAVPQKISERMDLKLETIGFLESDINKYVKRAIEKMGDITKVQTFIQENPSLQDLVKIPVQLDVLCYSWSTLPEHAKKQPMTMTRLYQAMVQKLFCKDGVQLQKESRGKNLTLRDFKYLQGYQIDKLMADEIQYLGYLAYKAMQEDHLMEFKRETLQDAMAKLDKIRKSANQESLPLNLLGQLRVLSFLRTVDDNTRPNSDDPALYFLHLTFQEYFAAVWVTQMLEMKQKPVDPAWQESVNNVEEFILHGRFIARYEIVLQMVAGLSDCETFDSFFELIAEPAGEMDSITYRQLLLRCWKEAQPQLLDPEKQESAVKVVARYKMEIMLLEDQLKEEEKVEAELTDGESTDEESTEEEWMDEDL